MTIKEVDDKKDTIKKMQEELKQQNVRKCETRLRQEQDTNNSTLKHSQTLTLDKQI